jgi:hypothetical protein
MLQPIIRHSIQLFAADVLVDSAADSNTVYALKTGPERAKNSEAELLARACRWGRILLRLTIKSKAASPVFTVDGLQYGWAAATLAKPTHPLQETISPILDGLYLLEIHQVIPADITHIALATTVTTLDGTNKVTYDYTGCFLYLEV